VTEGGIPDFPLAELTGITINPKSPLDRVSDAMTQVAADHPEAPESMHGIVILGDGTGQHSVSFMNYVTRDEALSDVLGFARHVGALLGIRIEFRQGGDEGRN